MNMLLMTPYEFDQTNKGWRSLAESGDYFGAAEIIIEYINKNKIRVSTSPTLATLYFHAGQEYASAGERHYSRAIDCFKKSYKDSGSWDNYVSGTIAYIEKDATSLSYIIQQNTLNRNILERLLKALNEGDYLYSKNY